MIKQKWTIAAMLLLCSGGIGLSFYAVQKHLQHKQQQKACDLVSANQVAREYLRMYEQWSKLSPIEQSENPWGQGQYGGIDIQKKLAEGRSDRLTADLPELESSTVQYPQELTDVMYGPLWQLKVDKFRRDRALAEAVLIASTFLVACGSLIALSGSAIHLFERLRKNLHFKKTPEKTQEAPKTESKTGQEFTEEQSIEQETLIEDVTKDPHNQQDQNKGPEKKAYFSNRSKETDNASTKKPSDENKKPSFLEQFAASIKPESKVKKQDDYFGWAVELQDKPELKNLMTTEPLTKELSELTEEVSAIRHFAAQQQDQMRKLQDGYDWMLVRRFCLRIIRCVDNVQDRITKLEETDTELCEHLKDVRDELVFALESGGVEQYEPDLNIPYKGLERYAEAIKERVHTHDEAKGGNIAEVVRCGYQYLVNDQDVKIVRCAQVKLYEFKQK